MVRYSTPEYYEYAIRYVTLVPGPYLVPGMRYGTTKHLVCGTRYSTIRPGAVLCATLLQYADWYSTTRIGTLRYVKVRDGTLRYFRHGTSVAQDGMVRYGTLPYCAVVRYMYGTQP